MAGAEGASGMRLSSIAAVLSGARAAAGGEAAAPAGVQAEGVHRPPSLASGSGLGALGRPSTPAAARGGAGWGLWAAFASGEAPLSGATSSRASTTSLLPRPTSALPDAYLPLPATGGTRASARRSLSQTSTTSVEYGDASLNGGERTASRSPPPGMRSTAHRDTTVAHALPTSGLSSRQGGLYEVRSVGASPLQQVASLTTAAASSPAASSTAAAPVSTELAAPILRVPARRPSTASATVSLETISEHVDALRAAASTASGAVDAFLPPLLASLAADAAGADVDATLAACAHAASSMGDSVTSAAQVLLAALDASTRLWARASTAPSAEALRLLTSAVQTAVHSHAQIMARWNDALTAVTRFGAGDLPPRPAQTKATCLLWLCKCILAFHAAPVVASPRSALWAAAGCTLNVAALLAATRALFLLSKDSALDASFRAVGLLGACAECVRALQLPGARLCHGMHVSLASGAGSVLLLTCATTFLPPPGVLPPNERDAFAVHTLEALTYIAASFKNISSDATNASTLLTQGALAPVLDILLGATSLLTQSTLHAMGDGSGVADAPDAAAVATASSGDALPLRWLAANEKQLMQLCIQLTATLRNLCVVKRTSMTPFWEYHAPDILCALLQLPRLLKYTELVLNVMRILAKLSGYQECRRVLVDAHWIVACDPNTDTPSLLADRPWDAGTRPLTASLAAIALWQGGAALPAAVCAAAAGSCVAGTGVDSSAVFKQPLHTVFHALAAKRSNSDIVIRACFTLANCAVQSDTCREGIASGFATAIALASSAAGALSSSASTLPPSHRGLTMLLHMLSSGVNAFLEACATSTGDAPKPASLASCALPTAPSALSALDQSADAVAKLCRLIANLCITPDLAAIVIRSKAFDALPLLLHLVCTTRTVRGGGGSALPEDDAALPHAPELLSTVISMVTNASFFVSPADVNRAAEAALVAVEAAMKLDAAAHGSGTPAGWHVALALSSSSTYGGHGLAGVLPSLLVLFADVVAAATAQLLASALEAASEESAAALAFQEQVATECLRAMSNIVRSPSARLLLYTIASDAASSDASYTAPASSFPAALVCLLHGFVTASELEEECTSGRLAWCYNGDIVYTLCGVILNLVADPCWRMGAAMPQHGVALLTTVRAAPALRTAVEHAAGEWQRDLWQRLCQPSSLVDLLCAATSAAYSGVADDSVATVCMQALVNYCQGWRRDPVVASDGGEDTGGAVGVDAVDARFSYAQALSLLTLLGNILDDAVAGEGMDTPLASVALQLRAEIKDMVDVGAFFDANE